MIRRQNPKERGRKRRLQTSWPLRSRNPAVRADLQSMVTLYFSDKRSVIEQEELALQDSSFLSFCPKWSKIQKQHKRKEFSGSAHRLQFALRAIELLKQMTAFKGEAKAVKLFCETYQDRGAGEAAAKGRHTRGSGGHLVGSALSLRKMV
ncbi:hypothetical protein KUCAC02_010340 [Chaenocephalus aceratus]|uniref:Uncharacterized protein n=1 Tax=Chaenocephalus aceratus TaxID=36190 RepID=A0ACB9W001_CHAAC|nr:hypothetical protein KUCAC02_010340 [Chaenocephalus aceratus]